MVLAGIFYAALLAQAGPACFDAPTQLGQMTVEPRKFDGSAGKVEILLNVSSFVDIRVQQVADEIVSHTGMTSNFAVAPANIKTTMAYIDDTGKRMLLYNPGFVEKASHRACKDWGITGVIAHEIGHHIKGHTLRGKGVNQHQLELDADDFAGFVLYRLGATLEQAQRATTNLRQAHDTPTHPGTARRLEAVKAGWLRARGIASDEGFYDEQRNRQAVSQQNR
jgi:hypothetical protein